MICHYNVMSRSSRAASGLPPQSLRAIKQLGLDLSTARKRRRIPQKLMAEKMLVSVQTLQRLEAGDPTVGLATLAAALFVLGLTARLERLVSAESDGVGMGEDIRRLPRTIHKPTDTDLDF